MPTNHQPKVPDPPGILASLRALAPDGPSALPDALRLAEAQAAHLLRLTGVVGWPVPGTVVTDRPRIRIEYRAMEASGLSYWDTRDWVICLNEREPRTRQRFTLLHEYKHIIDHGRSADLYPGSAQRTPEQQAEQAADYFAGCVLVPERQLKRAWRRLVRDPAKLAQRFDVSFCAMSVRLAQVGLAPFRRRSAPARRRPMAARLALEAS